MINIFLLVETDDIDPRRRPVVTTTAFYSEEDAHKQMRADYEKKLKELSDNGVPVFKTGTWIFGNSAHITTSGETPDRYNWEVTHTKIASPCGSNGMKWYDVKFEIRTSVCVKAKSEYDAMAKARLGADGHDKSIFEDITDVVDAHVHMGDVKIVSATEASEC